MRYLEVMDRRTGTRSWMAIPDGWTDEQIKTDIKRAYNWLEPGEIREEAEKWGTQKEHVNAEKK